MYFFHTLRYPLPTSGSILESLFSKLEFGKEGAIFFLLDVMSEKQVSTISKSLKFTGSICRILKSQETISLAKVLLTE